MARPGLFNQLHRGEGNKSFKRGGLGGLALLSFFRNLRNSFPLVVVGGRKTHLTLTLSYSATNPFSRLELDSAQFNLLAPPQ